MVIYRKDGTEVYELESFNIGSKLVKKLMSDDYVIIPFVAEVPVNFQLGDYLDVPLGGGYTRYELVKPYIPAYDTNTATYKYDLRLDAYYMKWANKICKYNPLNGGSELSFSLTASIGTHTAIILDNLSNLGYTYWATNVYFTAAFDDTVDQVAAKLVQYDSISILDAVTSIAKAFECEWWVTDNVIHFGKCQKGESVQEVEFELGGNISDMSKSGNGTEFITKLYAFGSERNLPRNYKSDNNPEVVRAAIVQRRLMLPTSEEISQENAATLAEKGYVLNNDGSLTTEPSNAAERLVEGVYVNDDVYPKTECEVSEVTSYERQVEEEDGTTTTYTFYRIKDSSGFDFQKSMILEGQTLHIIFTSGSLNGMDFEAEYSDSEEYYEIVANETYGRKLPDTNLHPSVGDKFAPYNWDSSQSEGLIPAASNNLLEEVIKYLDKAKIDPNDYNCTEECFEDDYVIRELGDKVRLVNPAYFPDGRSSRIIGIEINLDLPYDHPKYICAEKADYVYQGKVAATEELTFNGQSYQSKSSGGGSSVYVITTNDTTMPSDSNVFSAKRTVQDFLSSMDDDTARGLIKFILGLQTGDFRHGYQGASIDADGKAELDSATIRRAIQSLDFVKGQLGGSGWGIYDNQMGKSTLEVDNLIVRMKAIFAELEIRKLSYLGGDYIFSAAGSKICKVQYIGHDSQGHEIVLNQTKLYTLTDGLGNFVMQGDEPVVWEKEEEINPADIDAFRCFMYSDDGTTATMNWWEVDDQARCQTFNVKERGTTNNASNRYYWRRVIGVGSKILEDGREYNYIDLSVTDCSLHDDPELEDDWPAPNDAVVQLGNRDSTNKANRQNAIEIIVEGDDAPAIIEYAGIYDYNLASHRRTKISPKGDEFVAKSFSYVTSNGTVPIPRDLGEWNENDTYYYYDRVSWNGALWLCMDASPDGIHGRGDDDDYVPSDGSEYWLKQVAGGQQGTPGQSAPTMVCVPNPVMVYTDKNKIAVGSWSTDIAVTAYYNGSKVNILANPAMSVTKDGLWTVDTPTVDANGIGHVVIHGSSGVAVPNGTLRITAYIANPLGGNNIPVNGSVTVSPTMRGGDGESVPQVLMNPEVVWIPTNSQSYLSSNYSGSVNLNIVGANGMFAQELESITFNEEEEYSIIRNQVKVVRVFLDGIVHEDMVIGVEWASSFMVQSLDIPLAITYTMQQGEESKVVHAVLSIRASKQGARGNDGENALSLQYSPTTVSVNLDDDEIAINDLHFGVEVRAYYGTSRVSVNSIRHLGCNDATISGDMYFELRNETINGTTYSYAVIHGDIWEGYTYDTQDTYVSFDVIEDENGYAINGGFPIFRLLSGSSGRNGRGISSMEVKYGKSSSAVQQPTTWENNIPPLDQGDYLWSRTTFHFTDLSQDQVLYSVMYQAADGENGTSVSIKGTAIGHTRNQSYAEQESEKGFWLIDENGGSPSIAAIINTAVSPSVVTIPDAGDGYIVESTGRLWLYSDSGWIDAGRIKGDDGRPSYIHYAWANSADGSDDFTTTKEIGENYLYMGVCADNNPEDPGNDYDPDQDYDEDDPKGHPWESYEWNLIKGADGNNGTSVKGKAIAYLNTATAQVGYTFDNTGYFVIDLPNHTINSNGQFVNAGTGLGWGHKLLYYQKLRNTFSVYDVDEGDAYIVDGDLYSSVDFHWVNLGRYVGMDGENAYIHYAWADDVRVNDTTHVMTVVGFTTTKLATEDKPWIGVRTDNEELDSQEPTDYQWTLVKGNGIAETKIFYAKSQDGTNPPNEGWTENLSSILPVAPLWYLWTKTVIRFTQGGQDSEQVSYSVAYSGKEGRDGRSVVILGSWPTATTLPLPDGQGKIELAPGGEKTHALEISEGFVVEENGHLYVWLGGETKWKDVGKFNGDDGQTSYLHIAWANKIVYDQYGMVIEVEDFTVEKQDGEDYIYMGVCSDCNEIDPDALPTDDDFLDVVNLYKWNKIKGAEGSNGTKIRCDIVAHAETLSNSITESGWYAVDNSASWIPTNSLNKLTDPTPCLRKRTAQGAWPKTEVDDDPTGAPNWRPFYEKEGVYYPDEGESFIDQDGVLWSYIEAKWVNLGKYTGDSAYLHLAWADSLNENGVPYPENEHGFVTAKTTTKDYPYVGFCSNNSEEDPQNSRLYTWQRLRGLGQPLIVTDSDQVIVDADADGKITSLDNVTGLPTSIGLSVDGRTIGINSWKFDNFQCLITLVYSDGTTSPIPLTSAYPSQKYGIRLSSITLATPLRIAWTYVKQNEEDPVIPLRQIKIHIVATDSDFDFSADKTIPVIVNKQGNGTQFRVQYAPTRNGDWHDTFQDGDKWMRISDDGGMSWGNPIKIVASDMNVKGEAYFHKASVPSKPSGWDDTHVGLVDTIGSSHALIVQWSGSTRTDTVAAQGECYILRDENDAADGHLFIATENGWQDIGQIAGADGANAVAMALNPASIILNQRDDGSLDTFSTNVVVVDGNTPVTNFTIGQPDIAHHQEWHTASASVNNQTKTVTMTAANNGNVPYDHGCVDIPVTYYGSTWTLRFNWYANLLGTWKQIIIGDVNQSIANLRIYAEDETGNIIVTTSRGTYTLSATLLSNVLEEYAANAEDNPEGYGIMSRSMVEQTAHDIVASVEREVDGIQTDVSQLQMTANQIQTTVSNLNVDADNLFSFSANSITIGSYGATGIVPFIQGYGVECKAVQNRITRFGLEGKGGNFVVTCEMKMQQYGNVTVNVSLMDASPVEGGTFTLSGDWVKKEFVFKNISDAKTLMNNMDGYLDFRCESITNTNRLYVRNLMLSRGDCKPTGFIISQKDMAANIAGDILSFTKHDNVVLQSEKVYGYPVYKMHVENGVTPQTDMLFALGVTLRQNQCYSLSFYARATQDCHIACFMHGTGSTVDGSMYPQLVISPQPALKQGEMSVGNAVDGCTYIHLTSSYKRYTVYWWNASSNARNIVLGRVQGSFTTAISSDIYITGIEFREGYWTEDKLNSQSMIRQTATKIEMKVNETGINIEDGTITLNADNTTIIGDLSLRDADQGLVLYDQNNIARVAVKSDELGNIGDYDFGSRLIAEKDAISVGGTATFDTFELGNVSNGDTINIPYIVVSTNIGAIQNSVHYSYEVRVNNQLVGNAVTGIISGQGRFVLDAATRTAGSTGTLTLVLTLTNVTGNVSFHAVVHLRTTSTGLNKIGKDGAVFARDSTHYNWFGSDKTELRQGDSILTLSENGLVYRGCEIGRFPVRTLTGNTIDLSAELNNRYDEFLLVNAGSSEVGITLPQPNTLTGKKYYIKSLRENSTYIHCAGRIIKQDSRAAIDYTETGNRSMIFISTGQYWITFYCG